MSRVTASFEGKADTSLLGSSWPLADMPLLQSNVRFQGAKRMSLGCSAEVRSRPTSDIGAEWIGPLTACIFQMPNILDMPLPTTAVFEARSHPLGKIIDGNLSRMPRSADNIEAEACQ